MTPGRSRAEAPWWPGATNDPRLAAATVGRVEQAVGSWANPTLPHPTSGLAPAPEMAELDRRLERLAYRHLLVDDPGLAARNLEALGSSVCAWSGEVAATGRDPEGIEHDGGADLAIAQRWARLRSLPRAGPSPEP